MTLGDLHKAIQAAMGWRDCHLHAFDIGGEQFGDRRSVDDVVNENRPTLNGLLRSSVVRFATIGNTRSHSKKASRRSRGNPIRSVSPGSATVRLKIAGGVWGYEELLAILA